MYGRNNLKNFIVSKLTKPRGEPVELSNVISDCELYTRLYGADAKYECYIKGNIGKKILKRRRIFTGGPFGTIEYASGKYLFIEISAKELLLFIGEDSKWRSAMCDYARNEWSSFLKREEFNGFISSLTKVEISEEFKEKLYNYTNGFVIPLAMDIVNMDLLALEKKWKFMDESKWGERYLSSKDNATFSNQS